MGRLKSGGRADLITEAEQMMLYGKIYLGRETCLFLGISKLTVAGCNELVKDLANIFRMLKS